MKNDLLKRIVFLFVIYGFMGGLNVCAQNGQPHSVKAEVSFSDVKLSWKPPTDPITLQWHDGKDYNGFDGILKNPQGSIELYAASKFSASFLTNYVGQKNYRCQVF